MYAANPVTHMCIWTACYYSLDPFCHPSRAWSWMQASHSWTKWQKPAKNCIKKFVKLTGHTYACSSLTNFEYVAHTIVTKNDVKTAEIGLESSWNHIKWTYFWQNLVIWNHCARPRRSARGKTGDRRDTADESGISTRNRLYITSANTLAKTEII